MKERILKLRSEGKTYNQIQEELGCSKGTISYHCGSGQKKKSRDRKRKHYNKKPLFKKVDKFKSRSFKNKTRDFQRNREGSRYLKGRVYNFNEEDFYNKIKDNPTCYLTGRNIDLFDTKSYNIDHINPVSKGGDNSLENAGLACKEANSGKNDLTVEEFLNLCKEVLLHNGYTVSKLGSS